MEIRLTNYLGNHYDLQWAEAFGVLYKRWFLANCDLSNRHFLGRSLISNLKLLTQELVSQLSIVALTFWSSSLGVSFLGPTLKRFMCYPEFYCDRIGKFWIFSLLLKPVQTGKASPDNATLTKHDSMSHTHALCLRAHLVPIPGQKLSP